MPSGLETRNRKLETDSQVNHDAGDGWTNGAGSDHGAAVCAGVGVSLRGADNPDGFPVRHFLCLPDESCGVASGKTSAWARPRHRSDLSAVAGPGSAVFRFHGTADRPRRGAPSKIAAGPGSAKFGPDRGTTGTRAWLERQSGRPASGLSCQPRRRNRKPGAGRWIARGASGETGVVAGDSPALVDFLFEGWPRIQRNSAGFGAVAAAARTAAGRAQRPEPDAGPFHPGTTHPGGADAGDVFRRARL